MAVGHAPGGGVDTVARLLAEPMRAALGQPVVVENRAGASAIMIAARAVARGVEGGRTPLVAAAGEIAANPALHERRMT